MSQAPKGSYRETGDPGYAERRARADEMVRVSLRQVLNSKGVTIAQAAQLMGLSPAALRHRLYGRTEMSAAELFALSWALGVDARVFYDPEYVPEG